MSTGVVRSTSIPKLREARALCMRNARLCSKNTHRRDVYLELARQTNWQIVRSDLRARQRLLAFRELMASLA